MCSKTSPMGEEKQMTRTSMRIKNKKKQRETNNMEKSPWNNKIRTQTKKLKLLSLKLEQRSSHGLNNLRTKKIKKRTKKQSNTKVADTTPFTDKKRAENLDDDQYETAAAYLFNSATDSTISSIHDLLSSSVTELDCAGGKNLSPYDLQEHRSSSSSLLRTAMKKWASEEEETTEERWVSYSEVMSQSGTPQWGGDGRPSLALKLDYDQIMEAWSDKGTLYVNGEPPQTVPDLHASSDGIADGGEAGSLWAVPEMETTKTLWRGHREASLLRYKEKRQNRLFAKRIRYEVRKLNAEKRPRMKGRFVKRDDS